MRILLLGEYSNVHNTLARGLRELGHEVCVASNGDYWKNYPRDIDLNRELSKAGTLSFLWRLAKALPRMRGYDIVQIINPMFLELKAERIFPIYRYLRRHNKKLILGAYGMDYYWVKVNSEEKPLRYSDFNIGTTKRTDEAAERERRDWIGTAKQRLNEYIAHDCDGIVTGLYEYQVTYRQFGDKAKFVPMPIEVSSLFDNSRKSSKTLENSRSLEASKPQKFRIFVGISRGRSVYKGTDIMLRAAELLKQNHPDRVELRVAEGVPFDEYQHMMDSSDCVLDQLYSYTPGMNSLLAMSKGIINVGGGEPENYDILDETELRPILNVLPEIRKATRIPTQDTGIPSQDTGVIDFDRSVDNCYRELERLVLNPQLVEKMQQESVEYIRRHHDYRKVAARWIETVARF